MIKTTGTGIVLLALCLGSHSMAAESSTAIPERLSFDTQGVYLNASNADTRSVVVEEKDDDEPFLPFFGKEARDRGYELPKPYGINVNYMTIHQALQVNSITFEGLSLKVPNIFRPNNPLIVPIPADLFDIKVNGTRQQSHTETLRADAWLFPFMNVYGVVGHTKGKSVSKVDVGSTIPLVDKVIKGMGDMEGLDFVLNFKGTTYGVGTTFAGGIGNWFGLLDMNYTRTKLNIIKGNIKAFTLAPRLGYRLTLPAAEGISLPESKLNVWVGAMYQNVQQNFRGNLSDLKFSSKLQSIIDSVNWHGNGEFNVKQRMNSPWNMLAGLRWEVTPNFAITTEAGFIRRTSFFASVEGRF